MTEFDFESMERAFNECESLGSGLRERAADAFEEAQTRGRHRLILAAAEILEEILGVSATEIKTPEVNINPSGYGNVEVIVENIRFRVTVGPPGDDEAEDKVVLQMHTKPLQAWAPITRLEDVGRALAKNPCYDVTPSLDGRGSE